MLNRGKRSLVAFAIGALVLALGAGSASGAGLRIHAGRIGGIVRPINRSTAELRTAAANSGVLGGREIGPGSPSPYCGSTCLPPLLYDGGPVMHAVTTHVIAWAPSGYSFPSGYVSGYETYLSDLRTDLGLSSNVSSVAGEYVDATGPALSSLTNDSAINDTASYPTTGNCAVTGASVCLTESQLLTEVGHLIAANGLNMNIDQSYIVLLPPNVDTCTDSSSTQCEDTTFCGYHDLFTLGGGTEATFTLLPYTQSSYNGSYECYDPTVTPPNGASPDLTALDSIGTHELIESATDPAVGTGYLDVNGWEIGDECAWIYGQMTAASVSGSYNQLDNHDPYVIQMMWSNQDNNCEQGTTAPPAAATITPGASPVTNSPTSFSVSLSHDASNASTYDWSYVDPSGSLHPNVSSSATPQFTLSTAGSYTVWVEITDAVGGTITGVSNVTVAAAPTAAFSYSYSSAVPATGTPIGFTSLSSAYTGENITNYAWDFGDGNVGSGTSVSHTYTSPGPHTVTLTVTETDGHTAHTSQVVTVDSPPTSAFTADANPVAGTGTAFSSGATAGSGSITAYSWDFGDGGTSTAPDPTHTYSAAGDFTVSLTVTQTDGLTAMVQHTVSVAATAAAPPAVSPAWLAAALAPPSGHTAIATLLRKGGVTSLVSAPNASGTISIIWYGTLKHHRIVVARGSASMTAGTAAHVVVRLTAAGRTLLRRSRSLRISAYGVYDSGGSIVRATRTFTLRH